jgi:hypothetical protein
VATRRNNLERTKAPSTDSPISTTATQNTTGDNLFSFVTPTEFVELPSRGRFYSEDHPLRDAETVEIKHMTAKEEDILTSETLLKKGLAINRLISSILVNPNIEVDSLLLGDKNAILVASRITGFGPFYNVNTTCPDCKKKSETIFNLEDITQNYADDLPDDVELVEDGSFSMTLPISGVTVAVKLLTSKDETFIARQFETKKKLKKADTTITDLLKAIMVGVNEHTDTATIHKFIDMMPMRDVTHLRKQYEKVKPDLDLKFDYECNDCDHAGRVVMPMTAQFFWPNQ